jgi:hypothetical protein
LIFNSPGYPLRFIQKQICRDASDHLFTLIYKFNSPITRYAYVLRAEYHEEQVFALKFYAQKDSKSDYKYSHIINKGDVYNILITCLKSVQLILQDYPEASFGFIGARTVDPIANRVEDYENTQRFRVYSQIVEDTIGDQTFEHFIYEAVSGYLLVNRAADNIDNKERLITQMFIRTYNNLLNV